MTEAVPKIEGHASFYAHLRAGRVDQARIIGLDGDRFVEKILFGRKYWEAPIITSRICGICPVIHNITSAKGVEAALGIKVSSQTETLRKLMLCGQMIQSHALHLYLLVLPDFVGMSSSFGLQKNHPELFADAVALKKFADLIIETIGGRAVHPVSNVVGGFKKFPSNNRLKKLLEDAKKSEEIALKTLNLFSAFDYPEISRDHIYSALSFENEYPIYAGEVRTTDGSIFESDNYTKYIYEELVPYNRAKFATLKGKEMMVGAIARMNINSNFLPTEIKTILKKKNISNDLKNPFDNILAQVIELYYFVILSQKLVSQLLKDKIVEENIVQPNKFTEGTSACEAPRGTLFHYYKIDKDGAIIKCDIVTPTVQNLPSLEKDMKLLGPLLKDKKPAQRNHLIEMLIRAYDPCITCATH